MVRVVEELNVINLWCVGHGWPTPRSVEISGAEVPPRPHSSRPPSLLRICECQTINDRTSVALVKRQFLPLPRDERKEKRKRKEEEEDETGTPEIVTAKVEDE